MINDIHIEVVEQIGLDYHPITWMDDQLFGRVHLLVELPGESENRILGAITLQNLVRELVVLVPIFHLVLRKVKVLDTNHSDDVDDVVVRSRELDSWIWLSEANAFLISVLNCLYLTHVCLSFALFLWNVRILNNQLLLLLLVLLGVALDCGNLVGNLVDCVV